MEDKINSISFVNKYLPFESECIGRPGGLHNFNLNKSFSFYRKYDVNNGVLDISKGYCIFCEKQIKRIEKY